jgi:hypothetical protein
MMSIPEKIPHHFQLNTQNSKKRRQLRYHDIYSGHDIASFKMQLSVRQDFNRITPLLRFLCNFGLLGLSSA